MAAKEMYDYLSAETADYTAEELSLSPQHQVVEEGGKTQVVHKADDGSEERISLNDNTQFYLSYSFAGLSESEAGTLYDMFHNTSKANGIVNSFYLQAYDGHTYTVRFDSEIPRTIGPTWVHKYSSIRFRVLGRKP